MSVIYTDFSLRRAWSLQNDEYYQKWVLKSFEGIMNNLFSFFSLQVNFSISLLMFMFFNKPFHICATFIYQITSTCFSTNARTLSLMVQSWIKMTVISRSFLFGNFLYTDEINTRALNTSIYWVKRFDFPLFQEKQRNFCDQCSVFCIFLVRMSEFYIIATIWFFYH